VDRDTKQYDRSERQKLSLFKKVSERGRSKINSRKRKPWSYTGLYGEQVGVVSRKQPCVNQAEGQRSNLPCKGVGVALSTFKKKKQGRTYYDGQRKKSGENA